MSTYLFYNINVSCSHICSTHSQTDFPSVYQSLCSHGFIKQKKNQHQDIVRQI